MNNSRCNYAIARLKVKKPCRDQVSMNLLPLDDLIPGDHKARMIWEFVEGMNTDPLYEKIKVLQHSRGREATNPDVLFGLWLLALTDGITSGREIVRLATEHLAYQWMAGGITVNRTTLCEFRSADPGMFRRLMISCLALMTKLGLIGREDMAQDGSRVEADAGGSSCRREAKLEELEREADEYLRAMEAENKRDPNSFDQRQKAARIRAAKERKERVSRALKEIKQAKADKIQNQKDRKKKPPVRKN